MSRMLLQIEGLVHEQGAARVLDGVSLEVREGECFGLLGPNGSGKSTLLSVLAGLRELQRGEVRVRGESLRAGRERWLGELGVVFQSPALDPALSVRENLDLAAMMRGLSGEVRDAAVSAGLEEAGLRGREEDRVAVLSGGLRRRLDVARALLHRPGVLLLDEPSSGLDEGSYRAMWERLEERRERDGLTVIVATHRPDEAARCDRLAVLDEGRLLAVQTPAGLLARVGASVIVLFGDEPEEIAEAVNARMSLDAVVRDGAVHVECVEEGAATLPRVLEVLKKGAVRTAVVRRPSLADVFALLTGRRLLEESSLIDGHAKGEAS